MRKLYLSAAPSRTTKVQRKYRFRAFYVTVLCISLFAVLSLIADTTAKYRHGDQYGAAQRRALEGLNFKRLVKRDEDCRLVHHAKDKCAFILANCPDEEAGLLSYLSLYYCNLEKVQPIAFIILSLWLAMLFTMIGIAASDFFCINLSTIASILGMTESMAGVTFLAFGNGSPDVFSTFAAMSSHSGSLAVGELIGAAGFITAVVAGSMALVREFKVGKKTFVRDVGFFIVAASFSMIFLADGALHLWECCAMVAFYLFYVVTVVVWHWYLGRRRKRREREAAARGHYLVMTNDESEATEEDGDDEDAPAGERRYRDIEDFGALERGSSPAFGSNIDEESDGDGEGGMQLASEMASSMRVLRPKGNRRNTITPIRPSLVGALEFRSVLSLLQKSQGLHPRPIHLRRYSDDPTTSAIIQQDGSVLGTDVYSDNASTFIVTPAEDSNDPSRAESSSRTRAVSMNNASSQRYMNPAAFSVANVPDIGTVAATPTFPRGLEIPAPYSVPTSVSGPAPTSPNLSSSLSPSNNGLQDADRSASQERPSRDIITPLDESHQGAKHLHVEFFKDHETPSDSPGDSARNKSREQQRPRLQILGTSSRKGSHSRTLSSTVQFPDYTDSPSQISSRSSKTPSLNLPDPSLTPDSLYNSHELECSKRPIDWWPYHYLPSPHTLLTTLFPTLVLWGDKSVWDKFVGVVSAVPIFLLAITLPVVETESQDEENEEPPESRRASRSRTRSGTTPILVPDSPSLEGDLEWQRYRRATNNGVYPPRSPQLRGFSGHSSAALAVSAENPHQHSHSTPTPQKQPPGQLDEAGTNQAATLSSDWNRWLVVVQIFTAPLFVVTIIWANGTDGASKLLIQLVLYSLLGSLIAVAILLLITTPTKPPKYRFLLCFLGFVVAIAWISTIANEVVGVLKALGVILGISDAILGLTIFAVGNSLGDLVADITVARLGYPVMALSACFGGPMLNILLGIGLGGLYMTITAADQKHAKHPGKKIKYKPYEIEISNTLLISAVTLLITLVGLLIAVPLNKWVMSKRIGYGLILLWSISTVVNLAVEISGAWAYTASLRA